jgi:hypothetical protein
MRFLSWSLVNLHWTVHFSFCIVCWIAAAFISLHFLSIDNAKIVAAQSPPPPVMDAGALTESSFSKAGEVHLAVQVPSGFWQIWSTKEGSSNGPQSLIFDSASSRYVVFGYAATAESLGTPVPVVLVFDWHDFLGDEDFDQKFGERFLTDQVGPLSSIYHVVGQRTRLGGIIWDYQGWDIEVKLAAKDARVTLAPDYIYVAPYVSDSDRLQRLQPGDGIHPLVFFLGLFGVVWLLPTVFAFFLQLHR